MIEELKKQTKRGRKKSVTPVPNAPVLIISRVNGEEVVRMNPNSLGEFVKENNLDIRACESIINRTYVNHEGYTFRVVTPEEPTNES